MTQQDDPLFRALRQVADEALEEDIPERLLRVIRAARNGSQHSDEPGAPREPPKTGRKR